MRVYDARRAEPTRGGPGIVSAIDTRGIVVGTRDGSIAIGRLRIGDKKVAAPDAATALGLVVGQSLGDS